MGDVSAFHTFWSDVLATLLGGSALAGLFFLVKEKVCPIADVTGLWHVETRTTESEYKPFDGMVLRFRVLIWRDATRLHGSSEKVQEESKTGRRSYVGEHRTRGVIVGAIEKNYISADKIYVHIEEYGEVRNSTTFFELEPYGKELHGSFNSMIANQKGTVVWKRTPF